MTSPITDSVTGKVADLKATSGAQNVNNATLLAGEDQSTNRLLGGSAGPFATVASTTTALIRTGATIFYGVRVLSSGGGTGTIAAWDGTSSAGSTYWSAVAISSAETFIPAAGAGGLGVRFATGLTIQLSSNGTILPVYGA